MLPALTLTVLLLCWSNSIRDSSLSRVLESTMNVTMTFMDCVFFFFFSQFYLEIVVYTIFIKGIMNVCMLTFWAE